MFSVSLWLFLTRDTGLPPVQWPSVKVKSPVVISESFWHRLALAVLVLQPLIFYRRHLFWLTAHIPFDIKGYHLPLTTFIARAARQGVWPFWDPLVYGGVPIHADITAQLFYPLTWIAIGLDSMTGGNSLFYWLQALTPFHMIIGGIGAYFLFRKFRCPALVALFGGTVFQIGPFFVSQAQHLGSICTAAWLPWILLSLLHLAEGYSGRWLGGLALFIAMGFLSGFPATMLVVLGLSGIFCVALVLASLANIGIVPRFISGCILGAGISAIQLIPSMHLSARSVASLRYQWVGNGGGMHWESLASFVWPNFYYIFAPWDPRYTFKYDFTYMFTFCGHLSLALIAAAPFFWRKSRLLAISMVLWILSAIWMLGESTPVYPLILKLMPRVVQGAAYAETALLGFSLFAAATATLVLARLQPRMPWIILVVLVAANSWNLIRIGANKAFNAFPGAYQPAISDWADAGLPMPDSLRQMMTATTPPLRTDFLSATAESRSAADLFEMPSASGDNAFLVLSYYELRQTFSDEPPWTRKLRFRDLDNPWIQALNVGYVIEEGSERRPLNGNSYELLPFRKVHIYKVRDPLPRYYLQNRIRSVSNSQEALTVIRNPAFNPLEETLVEGLPAEWRPDSAASGSVKVVRYENNRVELDVRTSGRALLASSDIFYPGWTATVNGRPVDIFPTNVAFRGIPLEPGENHIVLNYFPEDLISSLIVSIFALVTTVLLMRR